MLILTPCISELVADDEVVRRFRDAVSNNTVIYVGWGTDQTFANEQSSPESELMEKLKNIVDEQGLPGVFLFYLDEIGNQEVVVDQQYYTLDWYQWLYQGEQPVCNQVVTRILANNYLVEQSRYLQGLFLKQLEKQLHEGYLDDNVKCLTWFYALLRLNEHDYIRETIAEQALEKVIANSPSHVLLSLLAVYVKVDIYEFGLTRLLQRLVKQDCNGELMQWLEKLYISNPQAYMKITNQIQHSSSDD